MDAAFAIHPDFQSHIGNVITYGRGVLQSISRKQKFNIQNSAEGELI